MVSGETFETAPMTSRAQMSERSAIIGGITMAMLFYGILAFFFVKAGAPDVLNGRLWDGDSYMWLVRAQDLWANGDWWNHVNVRISPPDGFAQHWTRPLDFLIFTGTLVLEPLMGVESARFWVGVFMNALISVPALFAFAWAARPLIADHRDYEWLWLVGVFFLFMPSGMANFAVGRPDHHALVILFTTLFLGAALRSIETPSSRKYALLAGLFAAVALWVSIQALPFMIAVMAAMGLWWLLGKPDLATCLTVISFSAALFMLAALFIEYGALAVGDLYDTLSPPYVAAFLLCGLFWLLLARLQERSSVLNARAPRILVATLLAAAILGVLWMLFPGFFSNPMDSDSDLSTVLMNPYIKELQPSYAALEKEESLFRAIGVAIRKGGVAIVALPVLLYGCFKAPMEKRPLWTVLLVLAMVYLPLAFFQIRWNGQANSIVVFPYAVMAVVLLRKLSDVRKVEKLLPLLRPIAIVLFSTWSYAPLLTANMLLAAESDELAEQPGKSCDYHSAIPVLNDAAGLGAEPQNIMMGVNSTAIILYETSHRVYAIANHRMTDGFQRLHNTFSAADDGTAHEALREARADLILTCKYAPDMIIHKTSDGSPSFHDRLAEGSIPDFLEPIALPEEAENLLLFRVLP